MKPFLALIALLAAPAALAQVAAPAAQLPAPAPYRLAADDVISISRIIIGVA